MIKLRLTGDPVATARGSDTLVVSLFRLKPARGPSPKRETEKIQSRISSGVLQMALRTGAVRKTPFSFQASPGVNLPRIANELSEDTLRRWGDSGPQTCRHRLRPAPTTLDIGSNHSRLKHGLYRRDGGKRGPARIAVKAQRECRRCAVGD